MNESEASRRAQLYEVLLKLSGLLGSDPVRSDVRKALDAGGTVFSGERKNVSVDEDWLRRCEEAEADFRAAIEQSRSLIKKDGEVVRIDRAKRPSKDSVAHLARHSNLIRSVTDDGRLAPEEIYITANDDDLAVYENRFLYLALTFTADFVGQRYDRIKRAYSETGVSLRAGGSVKDQKKDLDYALELSETSNGSGSAADAAGQAVTERIRNVMNSISGYLQSPLMKAVSAAPKLNPPIVRTNIIKNNVHFARIYELYSYLYSYRGPGYTLSDDAKNNSDADERTKNALADVAALQYFIAYQGVFSGWDESEAAYDEECEKRRAEALRRLRLSAEEARERKAAGKMTDDEYTALLERTNASLYEACEKAEEETAELRRSEREERQRTIRLAAERDMMADKLESTVKACEERIRENTARAEREYAEKADEKIGKERLAMQAEREAMKKETDLLTARLRGEGLIGADGDPSGDVTDRDAFLRLEDEYFALDEYYRRQWAIVKKSIRSREWKKALKDGDGK